LIALATAGIGLWRFVASVSQAERAMIVPLPSRVAAGVTTAGQAASPAPATPAVAAASQGSSSPLSVARTVLQAGTQGGDPGTDPVWGGRTDLTILVIGVDRRPDGGDQNADVIMLAHLDLKHKHLAVVSIPRDLLVTVPGVGVEKINGAYNSGVQAHPGDRAAGAALERDTVEAAFGVRIDNYVLVDFTGFTNVVDAVGGVDVTVPTPIHDDAYPTLDYGTIVVDFAAGPQHMDGTRALEYVRTRHQDSDDGRRQRQMDVLRALLAKGQAVGSVARAQRIVRAVGGAVQTDFSLAEQLVLARLALQLAQANVRMTAMGQPLVQPGWTADGLWVYRGDPTKLRSFVRRSLKTTAATPTKR
jgi:LCP family protein required for cell wall assembly